ncbi:dioxygenase [Persicimonas caeni]|uniref:Dioxygenase n=2 Tax=Persicimonas caeni TaxID=2292766 RepID=A0A4Y6Q498_PERCE|nr:dioxygenase [Persicimonas caeni]QED36037.1 dioxygenase [Persicimonas caeni]
MPVGYVGHGAPTLVFDKQKGADLRRWADEMPRPRAMLVISAHWQDTPVSIGTTERRELMYDFYGFPKELYEVEYDAPAAPELADRVAALLGEKQPVQREDRAMDHGVWVPMVHMAPAADIPILQISLPSQAGPKALFELGRKLAPLRDEGIFLLGSGSLVHNLRRIDFSERSSPESWAVEFDQWAAETLAQRNFDELIDYRNHAPGLRIAHPTVEHFEPILVAAGAASVDEVSTSFPVEGFEFGNLSRRCVQFG